MTSPSTVLHITPFIGRASFGLGQVALNLAKAQNEIGCIAKIWCQDKTENIRSAVVPIGISEKNGHQNVDILKMDIEGFEYSVFDNFLNKSIFPTVILVEFHHRFSGFGVSKAKETINQLKLFGYNIFFKIILIEIYI